MSTLKDVVLKLQENNDQLSSMNANLASMLQSDKDRARAEKTAYLDRLAESRKVRPSGPGMSAGIIKGAERVGDRALDFLGLGLLGNMLRGSLIPAFVGLTASVTGFDDALRALKIADLTADITRGTGRLTNVVKSVIQFGDDFIDIFRQMFKGLRGAVILPDELKTIITTGLDDATKGIQTAYKNFVTGFTRIGTRASGIIDDVLKLEDFTSLPAKIGALLGSVMVPFRRLEEFFTTTTDTLTSITKFMPSINFGSLLSMFGTFSTVAGEGSGLLGFIGRLIGIGSTLLSPLTKALRFLALNPITQFILGLIDFMVGFVKGFFGEDGTLLEKLAAGLEGGALGFIKGFTDAIDLLKKIPEFIAEKLGFEGVAEQLKDFSLTALVDPAWEATKKFFVDAFTNPRETFAEIAQTLKEIPIQFLKSILAASLPPPDMFRFTLPEADLGILGKFGGGTIDINPFPDSLYRFAGISPETGQAIMRPGGTQAEDISTNMNMGGQGQAPAPVVDASTTFNHRAENNMGFVMDRSTSATDNLYGGLTRFQLGG